MFGNIFTDTDWIPALRYAYRRIKNPRVIQQSSKYWASLRNKYAGRRGFVIGNGPSLKISDLEQIKGEISVAANRIYLAFPETSWRPTVHCCVDALVWQKYADEMCTHSDHVVINSRLNPALGHPGKVILYRNLGPCARNGGRLSHNAGTGMYSGATVTIENIQVAIHLGLNPIYLIGCDHFYKGEQNLALTKNIRQVVEHKSESNHFHPDYRKPGEKVFAAPIEKMEAAYRAARADAERSGIQIFNATRGGHLEIFNRANFDEIVPAAGTHD